MLNEPDEHQEIRDAALQFVRKVSGFPKPSTRNEAPFNGAVSDISDIVVRLLNELETTAPPKDRDV